MPSRWVAAAVVLVLVFGQSFVGAPTPLRDDRPDTMDAIRGAQSDAQAKSKSARSDPARPAGWQLALAPMSHGLSLARPDGFSIVETEHVARVHDHEDRFIAVARGPPAA